MFVQSLKNPKYERLQTLKSEQSVLQRLISQAAIIESLNFTVGNFPAVEVFEGVGSSNTRWHYDGANFQTLLFFMCSPPNPTCGTRICNNVKVELFPKWNNEGVDNQHVQELEERCEILESNKIHITSLGSGSNKLHRGATQKDFSGVIPRRLFLAVDEQLPGHFNDIKEQNSSIVKVLKQLIDNDAINNLHLIASEILTFSESCIL